jgi:hypothetical protein
MVVWTLMEVAVILVFFATGLSGIRFRRLPLIVGALLCLAYLVFLVGYGIWTATCPRCNEGELLREGMFGMGALVYGIILVVLLSAIGFGVLIARIVWWGILRATGGPGRARN